MFWKKGLVYILGIGILLSCQEDKDEIPPQISLESPNENASYTLPTSIHVTGTVSDDQSLRSIQLALYNFQNLKVAPTVFLKPTGKEYRLDRTYRVEDTLLNSEECYLKVTAFDEDNENSAFRVLRLNGVSKKALGVLVSTGNEVLMEREQFQFSPFFSLSSGSNELEINNHDQQLWTYSAQTNQLEAYQINEGKKSYSETVNSNYAPGISAIKLHQRNLFASFKDGSISRYSSSFSKHLEYQAPSGRLLGKIAVGERYLAVEEFNPNGSNRMLNVLIRGSGVVFSSIPLYDTTASLYFAGKSKLMIFTNTASGGELSELLISENSQNFFRPLVQLPGKILSVVENNAEDCSISCSDGSIYRYNPGNNTVVKWLDYNNAMLERDALNQLTYIASGSELYRYSDWATTPQASYTFNKEITGLKLRYNRD
jgi:hypothetical protein